MWAGSPECWAAWTRGARRLDAGVLGCVLAGVDAGVLAGLDAWVLAGADAGVIAGAVEPWNDDALDEEDALREADLEADAQGPRRLPRMPPLRKSVLPGRESGWTGSRR